MANIVASGNWWRFEDDGTLYVYCTGDMPDDDGVPWWENLQSIIAVDIASSVSSILDTAFWACGNLTSVTIPGSVTSIGERAFGYCANLRGVTIPNGITSIGDGAFEGCTSLASVTIPDSVTSIGDGAFEGCTSLASVTIPDSVTSIGGAVFCGCTSLTSVTIPNSVTSIGESAFTGCAFTSVTIPSSVTSIGGYAFSGCPLTSIAIPDGVTDITEWTFSYCGSLTSITIPSSVTSIGDYAFSGCTAITDVYYGGTEAQWGAVTIGEDNAALEGATLRYRSSLSVLIPVIPVVGLENPLAAVVQTLNFVIQNLNPTLASNKITEIIMNGVSKGTSGVVNLGTVLTEHQNISGKADVSTVNTLIGSDTGKSVRTIAAEELAAKLIPANAQEALNTLQEISAWIQSHPGEVAAINNKLTLGTVNGTEYATVKAYVEAMVSGLITLSALSVAVSGNGNAVTGVSYDDATGTFSFNKGATFLTQHQDISGKVDKVTGKGLSTNDYTDADKAAVGTIANKVNQVVGKGLSTNDYTDADKNKLSGIEAQANKTTIDSTLSNAGQAADAKAAGDEIAALRNLLGRMEIYCEASGNPATFSDAAAANVKALSVTLAPTQSGTGDPSPSNVRPITGVSSVNVTRTGKNLLPAPDGQILSNAQGTITRSGGVLSVELLQTYEHTVELSSGAHTSWGGQYPNVILKDPGTYACTMFLDALSSNVSNPPIHLYFKVSAHGGSPFSKKEFSYIAQSGVGAKSISITLEDGEQLVGVDLYFGNFTGSFSMRSQLEAGSTATAYESYQGQSVTVPLVDSNSNPLTVYGGTLDVTAGTLYVTQANIASYNGETLPGRWISDRDVYASGTTPTTGAQVVYELATPVTHQLTAQQLATLAGYNAVSSDAGTVAVTYKADTSLVLGGAT